MKKKILIISKITILFFVLISAISCSSKQVDVKSPCVSLEDGPCGKKRPVNQWLLKNQINS